MADKNLVETIESSNTLIGKNTKSLVENAKATKDNTKAKEDLGKATKETKKQTDELNNSLGDGGAKVLADVAQAASARIIVLNDELNKLTANYNAGKVSAEAYAVMQERINSELDGLSNKAVAAAESVEELNDKGGSGVESLSKKTTDLEFQMEKVGSSASTALTILSTSLSKTNPVLATVIGSVQKLIPNIVAIGTTAKKAGSIMKLAFSSTGIGLLVELLASAIALTASFISSRKQAAKKLSEDQKKAADDVRNNWKTAAESIHEALNPKDQWEKDLAAAEESISKGNEVLNELYHRRQELYQEQLNTRNKKRKKELQAEIDDVSRTIKETNALVAQGENDKNQIILNHKEAVSKSIADATKISDGNERKKLKEKYDELLKMAKGNANDIAKVKSWYYVESKKLDEKEAKERKERMNEIFGTDEKIVTKMDELRKKAAKDTKFLDDELKAHRITLEQYNEGVKEIQKSLDAGFTKLLSEIPDATNKVDEFTEAVRKSTEEAYEFALSLSEELGDIELPGLDAWVEWYETNRSEYENQLALIEEKRRAFEEAGVSEVEVQRWVKEQKAKLYADEAEVYGEQVAKMGTAYESILEYQLKSKKITQGEYEQQLAVVRAFQYAQTLINAAAGAIKIWAGEGTTAYKVVMSAGLAAEATTALLTIKNASMSSESAGTTTSSKQSVSYSSPLPQNTYVENQTSASDIGNEVSKAVSNSGERLIPVLVTDDLNKVTGRQTRVRTNSSF